MLESPFLAELRALGIVAVIRGASADDAVTISEALLRGGVRGIEITYSTPDCCTAIERLARTRGDEAVIGVGTVRNGAELEDAHNAGARFAVSPHSDIALIEAARARALPMLPGALTPTEVVRAYDAGASAVKLFPGSAVGPAYVKALRGPLPDIPIMPTGGVSVENMAEWFAAGVIAVGMGGNLAKGSPDEIEAAARKAAAEFARISEG